MQQIFINNDSIEVIDSIKHVRIIGEDAHHLLNVVRIKPDERLRVSISGEDNYLSTVVEATKESILVRLDEVTASTELSNKIYLFQALPKGDRMETIIEKCVELGVYEIIPVEMKHCVVKLDDKKKAKKLIRYQAIAEAAAKQSKRSIIPRISPVMSFNEAVEYARKCDINLVPYENADGMNATSNAMRQITDDKSVSIIIGPEGGFSYDEIDQVKDMNIISLGSRILRTDTAAICTCSLVAAYSEINNI